VALLWLSALLLTCVPVAVCVPGWCLVTFAAFAGWRRVRFGELVRLRLHGASIVLNQQRFTLLRATLLPGWLVLSLRAGGARRRIIIHRSEVAAADFARLRRFAHATLGRVTPRPAVVRRGGP
jgi:hypothetical protein